MRYEFGPQDEQGFQSARKSLLADFERWLRDRIGLNDGAVDDMAHTAGWALDWKWQYGDGHLTRWREDDLCEFLLDWCPRKLTVSQDESLAIPIALSSLMEFMHDQGRLSAGSAPIELLWDVVDALTGDFGEAMDDDPNFGLAKTLMGAAAADGVDFADPQQLQEWMNDFNSRPFDERREVLPDRLFARSMPSMPPVVLPSADEVTESRRNAPVLAKLAELTRFAGAKGRKLTAKGNIILADARVLVDLLETGDMMDEKIGDRVFRTTSSDELYVLRYLFAWAKKAGIVKVRHGRFTATKRGLALAAAEDRAPFFDDVVSGLLGAGVLSCQRSGGYWPDVDALLDQSVAHLLAPLYGSDAPVEIDEVGRIATAAVLCEFRFPRLSDDEVGRSVLIDVTDIFDALELAGVVLREGAVVPDDEWLFLRRSEGGTVTLTPAGVVVARRLLLDAGYDAPAAGRFANGSATELLIGTDKEGFLQLKAELDAWLASRDPTDAAQGLATAVLDLIDPALQNMALAAMSKLPASVAEPEVRKLAAPGAAPTARAFARCWLVDHGHEEASTLLDTGDLDSFVDVLAHRLITGGPEAGIGTLELAGSHQDQIDLIGRLWRSPSPAVVPVLEGLAQAHPSKVVAKAVRKALFRRRSWTGSGTTT